MTSTWEELEAFVARGWKVFPAFSIINGQCSCSKGPDCSSPGKHPRNHNGVDGATDDIKQLKLWYETFPGCNWGLATGQRSGVMAIDIDERKGGFESFDEYEQNRRGHGDFGSTLRSKTGGGGCHIILKSPDHSVRNRVNWLPGVDIRADGGYVILPNGNHISGGTYEWLNWGVDIMSAPDDFLLDIARGGTSSDRESMIAGLTADQFLEGIEEGGRDDTIFRMACKLRRQLLDNREAVTLLCLAAGRNSNPPFPDDETLRKVEQAFKQDHSDVIDIDRVPFVAPDGELYDFLAGLDAEMVEAVERAVKQAKVRALSARVLREERVAKYGEAAALDGDEFMFGEVATDVPIWGTGDDLLWVEGGGLMIPSDQGLGKSLTAQQLIAGRLGVGPRDLLGLPITPLDSSKVIVYLALDRPRQIARSMARLFRTPVERATAKSRLKIWTKPMPIDILGDPYAFADWAQDTFGANVGDLVIDSVKDLTPANLSNGEVGQALDMAWKECRARGMSTLVLHHERKTGGDESRANRQPSLDHIYGSVWLTSGMDSILHISGKQGENLVRYTHLKAIINMLDPIDAVHDQENGRTDVLALARNTTGTVAKIEQVYQVIEYGSQGGSVLTAADVVQRSGIAKASVDRYLKKLVEAGRVVVASEYDRATATPATYRVAGHNVGAHTYTQGPGTRTGGDNK